MAGAGHYHLSVKSVGRATRNGGAKSATAAAAYRSGGVVLKAAAYRSAEVMTDRATGEVFDYTRKQGVLETHILTPENVAAPGWAQDRNRLWNAAERAEPRQNGRIATEIEVALPHQLSRAQNRELVLGYAQGIADRYGVVADVAIHQGHDARNIHSHILFSHREITEHGFGDLSNRHRAEKGGREVPVAGIAAQSRDVEALRAEWGRHVNAAYERAGQALRVDHRSYQRQGHDLTPTRYLGPRQSHPERAQLREERAAYNERVMARRPEREQAHEMLGRRPAQQSRPAPEPEKKPQQSEREKHKAALRALPAAALEAEASVDMVLSGWRPMEVHDLARQLSPDYAREMGEAGRLRAELRKADWQLGRHEADTRDYAAKRAARWEEMSIFQKALDWSGFHQDKALAWHEAGQSRSYAAYQKAAIHRGALAGRLAMAERAAETAFETVRPAAEAALPPLRERAELAREVQGERLAQRERLREAEAERPAQKTQRPAPVAMQAPVAPFDYRPGAARTPEEQEEAAARYVQGLIARARSRPEHRAEEEQRQAAAEKARLAEEQRERLAAGPRQTQGQVPEERQGQRAQKRRQGQAMSQEERAEAYWQTLAARGRALKDEREEQEEKQTQRQTLRHGPRMRM
jgi:hypothetical protein